jgi:glycosyltransferase involved in cell wall biosynthesis
MKILISAYGCDPARGSEPGVGWNWSRYVAREHEVWVLVPESERPFLTADAVARERMQFVFCDLPAWIRVSNQNTTVRYHLHYYCWQILAFFVARKLHAKVGFDVIHHLILGTHWKPSFLALLPAPFVWGPLGGGESAPSAFLREFPWKQRMNERLRDFVRMAGEADPFVQMTARRASLTLAKTEQTAGRLRAMGAAHVEVMSEAGLSADELKTFSRIAPRQDGPFRLVSVGRMLHWKGFEFGLRAFARMCSQDAQSEYWLIGDGPYRSRLESLAADLGIAGRVRFLGSIPRAAAVEQLANCDVLVHPSVHDSGGWTCLEAMAAGKPVVCLDLGGPALQVTSESGFLVRADDPKDAVNEMAGIFLLLAGNPGLRARMGAAGRRRVQEHFAWEKKSVELRKLYGRFATRRHLASADTDV